MKELEIEALTDNLDDVMDFVDGQLEGTTCSHKKLMQVNLAVEEIFVNIANYAYGEDKGSAKIITEIDPEGALLKITFIDRGIRFDPLKKPDPDTTLEIAKRPIGGLGIFLVKKLMDEVEYKYTDGCNVLTITKDIS